MANFICLWSDRLVFLSLCGLVFVLPASTAGVEVFASAAIFFLFVKKAAAARLGLPVPRPRISVAVGLFLAVCFVSIFSGVDPVLSAGAFVRKALKAALLFFAVQECLTNDMRVHRFLRVLVASGFILCLDGLWQLQTGADLFKQHSILDGRINASFNHANGLGAYLVVLIPLAAVFVFRWAIVSEGGKMNRVIRFILAGAFLAVFMAVFGLTLSRGAWFGFMAAAAVFCLFDRRTWIPCLAVAGAFFLVFYPLLIQGRQVTLITDEVNAPGIRSVGGSGRIVFWQDAVRVIRERPFLGTGLNTYTKVQKQIAADSSNYVHNCYLQLTAELGVAGLAAILWLFMAVFAAARRRIAALSPSPGRWVLIALVAGWIGLLVDSGVDNVFYSVQLNVLLWVVMGVIVVLASAPSQVLTEEGLCRPK